MDVYLSWMDVLNWGHSSQLQNAKQYGGMLQYQNTTHNVAR